MDKSDPSPNFAYELSLKIKLLADASQVTEVTPTASPSMCISPPPKVETPDALNPVYTPTIWIPPLSHLIPSATVAIPTLWSASSIVEEST